MKLTAKSGRAPMDAQKNAQGKLNLPKIVEIDNVLWAFTPEFLVDVMKDIDTVIITSEGGGLSPYRRRIMILSKYAITSIRDDLTFFAAVHLKRGQAWRRYVQGNDNFAARIKSVGDKFAISTSVGHGRKSSQSAALALCDVLIGYRMLNKAIMITVGSSEEYNGLCPQQYCWLGSLGSMFIDDEEDKFKDDVETNFWTDCCWITKTLLYAHFLNWYIQVASINSKKAFSGDKLQWLISLTGGMHYAWSAWSMASRMSFLTAGDPNKRDKCVFASPASTSMYGMENVYGDVVIEMWKSLTTKTGDFTADDLGGVIKSYFTDNIDGYRKKMAAK